MADVLLGLKFGNTSALVSYFDSLKPQTIANADGDRDIPLLISIIDEEEYYATQARAQLVRNADKTVSGVRDGVYGAIKTSTKSGNKYEIGISVAEAREKLFKYLGTVASDFLGSNRKIRGVVLALPPSFAASEQKLLEEAAEKAGLPIIMTISEPSAALLALDIGVEDKTIAVCDFGATRSDVSIVASRGGLLTILSTETESIGGVDLDKAIQNHFSTEFKKNTKIDIANNERAKSKILLAAEDTKRTLTSSTTATISIESVAEGIDLNSSLNRIRFELLGRPIFTKLGNLVDKAIESAESQIDQIVLVGGTGNIPKLKSLFGDRFEVEVIQKEPSELVSKGCALQGALINTVDPEVFKQGVEVSELPSLSKSIFVIEEGDKEQRLFSKATLLPARSSVKISSGKAEIWEADYEITTEIVKDEDGEDEEISKKVLKKETKLGEVEGREIMGNLDELAQLKISSR